MRVLFSALAALVVLAGCSPRTEPALWRITDADSEIWLYGTVHVLRPETRWRGPRVNAAFAAADELITEIDTGEETAERVRALTAELGRQPAGRTLSAQLAPADRERLARVTRRLGIDAAALEQIRPWLASILLSYAAAGDYGHVPEAGVESVLTAEARQRGMTLSALETPEQQLGAIAGLAESDQVRLLTATLEEIETDGGSISDMDDAWVRGDVATLDRMLADDWAIAGPGVYEAIIAGRNRAWVEVIAARLEGSGRIFIAVGAAHLVGDENVVALLRARGIEVEGP